MRILSIALAAVLAFGSTASAGTLRYELEIPALELQSGSVSFDDGTFTNLTRDEILADQNSTGLQYYGSYFSSIFIEFETDFLPFSLRNTELDISNNGRIVAYDITGPSRTKTFEQNLGFDFEISLNQVDWLNGLTTANAGNEFNLSFDSNGDIFDWRVDLDDDKPSFYSSSSGNDLLLFVYDSLYSAYPNASYSDTFWSSPQTQSWTRTGFVPLSPSAVPLPASAVLLLSALGLIAGVRRRNV